MTTLINLLISAFILKTIGCIIVISLLLWGIKRVAKKWFNYDVRYLVIIKWYIDTIKSIFGVWNR